MKQIVLDVPTRQFLGALRGLRREAGISYRELAAGISAPLGTVKMYEKGRNYPSLPMLMRLVEFFGYDLSQSVNYKYYHRKVQSVNIKRDLRSYGLSYSEVASLTGYSRDQVYASINYRYHGSVGCFAAVIEVLQAEREAYKRLKRAIGKVG